MSRPRGKWGLLQDPTLTACRVGLKHDQL